MCRSGFSRKVQGSSQRKVHLVYVFTCLQVIYDDDKELKVLFAWNSNCVVVVFRGSTTAANWVADAMVRCTLSRVVCGSWIPCSQHYMVYQAVHPQAQHFVTLSRHGLAVRPRREHREHHGMLDCFQITRSNVTNGD
jgi:hypothetical protein